MTYVKGLHAALPAAEGDVRGHFGIGRAAHGSDPAAAYGFEAPRTALPPEPVDHAGGGRFRYETEIDDERRFTRIKITGLLGDTSPQLRLTIPGCSDAKTAEGVEADLLLILKRIVRDLQQRCDERLSAPPL